MPLLTSSLRRLMLVVLPVLLPVAISGTAVPSFGASHPVTRKLAVTPPMGWNDWAHYQCNYTAQDILSNARALVKTGLAARGYDTVTIDDCWMQKDRDASGNLQADAQRFPQGMKPVAEAIHTLGLKFGIYEDAGYLTCGKFAGSGEPDGGGKDHFAQDARLFASWGVDYLKLDGCNLYAPKGSSMAEVYRKAYAAQSAALKTVNRPIVFSESAPAYFQGQPDWYDVLSWVRGYGELWREGDDVANYHATNPSKPRFDSVLWNYAYNLPLGRFQKPSNWNDPDFIIGGDDGMSAAETRSQVALWSMMSAPLILSSDVEKLSSQSVEVLRNKAVIAIDQDALGRMATLLRRSLTMDLLFKPLTGGEYAVAVLNRNTAPLQANLRPVDLGFSSNAGCRFEAQNLWSGKHGAGAASLQADIAAHDTAIWKIHPSASCGMPTRTGTITMIATGKQHDIKSYSRCLSASGGVGDCDGSPAETWTVAANGALEAGGRCLAASGRKLVMQACSAGKTPRWKYTLVGNLIDTDSRQCLSAEKLNGEPGSLSMQTCGHNQPNQIWSLPN